MRDTLRLIGERRGARPRALVFAMVFVLLIAAAASAQQVEPMQEPAPLRVYIIPTPPQQSLAWETPATTLPEKLVTATAKLFGQGLADPRGCEYREVEIMVGSVWGGVGRLKTHAWVLPSSSSPSPYDPGYAVGWNGLVYPILSSGERANLRQDVLALVEADEKMRAKWATESPNVPFYRFRHASAESYSLSHQSMLSLKVPLLLRLGEGELARKVWDAWTAGMSAEVDDNAFHLKDPYLMFATEWVWALFDRTLTEHMRGDDRLALLHVGSLGRIRYLVEREAAARKVVPPEYVQAAPGERPQPQYLPFLEPLSALSYDQQVRQLERGELGGVISPLEKRSRHTVGASTSVGDLIRDLGEVSARQWGQPGGVSLSDDKVVQALIAKGDAAIEPLLWVIEKDTRLTRSVSFGRDFHYGRHLIGVHEAAYAALLGILKISAFGEEYDRADLATPGLKRRPALAARIRRYLNQHGGVPLEERWYRILADDGTTLEQWQQAAAGIVMPASYGDTPPQEVYSAVSRRRKGENVALRGEALRQKSDPSVSQLLARRMDEVASRLGGQDWYVQLKGARSFAAALSAWDGANRLEDLGRMTATLEKLYAAKEPNAASKRRVVLSDIVGLYMERLTLHDPRAAADYAAWLRTLRPDDTNSNTISAFWPASLYPDSPEIGEAVTRIFGDPSSPWVPIIGRSRRPGMVDTSKLLETGLLNFPAFRARVLEGLADRTVVGTLRPRAADPAGTYDPKVEYELKVDNLLAAAVAGDTQQPDAVVRFTIGPRSLAPSMSAPVSFRACDVYAWKLRGFEGAPWIELYWSEEARDSAVASSAKFLREHSGPFVYSETRAYRQQN